VYRPRLAIGVISGVYSSISLLGLINSINHITGVLLFLEIIFLALIVELQDITGGVSLIFSVSLAVIGAAGIFATVISGVTWGGVHGCTGFAD
jgi:hypothetical protein